MTDKPSTSDTPTSNAAASATSVPTATDPFVPHPVTTLRQRMIEDMGARSLNRHTQRSHISSCRRFAAWLKRSPDTATADDVRLFQLHLIESGASICNRNRIMTGVRFLFRVTLRRHDLAAEVWHMKEPLKLPPVLVSDEIKRVLACAQSLKARVMLTLAYGCGLTVQGGRRCSRHQEAGDAAYAPAQFLRRTCSRPASMSGRSRRF